MTAFITALSSRSRRKVHPAVQVTFASALDRASAKMCVNELADFAKMSVEPSKPPRRAKRTGAIVRTSPRPIIRSGVAASARPSLAGKKRVRFQRGDEEAVSSTAAVVVEAKAECAPVRTDVLCLLKPSSEMSAEEKSDVWWQEADFAQFRGTAQLISAEIRRRTAATGGELSPKAGRAPSYAQVVAHALDVCHRLGAAAAAADDDDCDGDGDSSSASNGDEAPRDHPLSKMVLAYLTHWSSVGHSRRGLEKWSVSYRRERFESDRYWTVRAVLEAQAQARARRRARPRESEGDSSSTPSSSPDDASETIGEASRRHSRGARMFALAMGMADAAAAGYKPLQPEAPSSGEGREDEIRVSRRQSARTYRKKIVSAAA